MLDGAYEVWNSISANFENRQEFNFIRPRKTVAGPPDANRNPLAHRFPFVNWPPWTRRMPWRNDADDDPQQQNDADNDSFFHETANRLHYCCSLLEPIVLQA